jgi:hypothetical protein
MYLIAPAAFSAGRSSSYSPARREASVNLATNGLFRRSGASTLGRFEVEAFRAGRSPLPLTEYEALLSSDRWADRFLEEVDRTLTEGWKRGGLPRIRVEPPVPWGELCTSNRSWQFHLQAWEPMSLVLSAYDHLGEKRYIDSLPGPRRGLIARYPSRPRRRLRLVRHGDRPAGLPPRLPARCG